MWKLSTALALAGATISLACSAGAQPPPGGFVDVPGGKLWYAALEHDGVRLNQPDR